MLIHATRDGNKTMRALTAMRAYLEQDSGRDSGHLKLYTALCDHDGRRTILRELGILTSAAPQNLFNVRATSVDESERDLTHQAKLLHEGHVEHSSRRNGDVCPVC
jgi:hypothetical protein